MTLVFIILSSKLFAYINIAVLSRSLILEIKINKNSAFVDISPLHSAISVCIEKNNTVNELIPDIST